MGFPLPLRTLTVFIHAKVKQRTANIRSIRMCTEIHSLSYARSDESRAVLSKQYGYRAIRVSGCWKLSTLDIFYGIHYELMKKKDNDRNAANKRSRDIVVLVDRTCSIENVHEAGIPHD